MCVLDVDLKPLNRTNFKLSKAFTEDAAKKMFYQLH